jgi:hypothetical protein
MNDINNDLDIVIAFLKNNVVGPYNELVAAYGRVITWLAGHLPPDLPSEFVPKSVFTREELADKLLELKKLDSNFSGKSSLSLPTWLIPVLQGILTLLQSIGASK